MKNSERHETIIPKFWSGKSRQNESFIWLVVSTHLKNISQIANLHQIGVKIRFFFKPPTRLSLDKKNTKNQEHIHLGFQSPSYSWIRTYPRVKMMKKPMEYSEWRQELPLGILAHLLKMVMEPNTLRFGGDCTPQSSSDKVIGSLGLGGCHSFFL